MNYLVTQMTSVGSGKVLFASMSQIRSPWIFQLVTLAYDQVQLNVTFKHRYKTLFSVSHKIYTFS